MTQEEISMRTKKALSSAFKNALIQKPLSKITISELCKSCGLNRKTFYYHFEDVYALMRWTLEQEAIDIVKNFDLTKDHRKALHFIIDYVDANKHLVNCVYDAVGREGMKRFFFSDLEQTVNLLIENVEKELHKTIDMRYRQFLCNFYANAFSGLLIDWFVDRSVRSREDMIDNISFTMEASLKSIVAHAPASKGFDKHT
ncbi:TetR/AcrR family transcriptional regulator C-terminal domain-containing protein [Lachnospiraceae bacterium 54-11]|jgi:probable dihydroxyacetone kinase regulator|nr:TetR family transcriptional regulator [Lachnospiraceae bacterium]